jgi:HK97 family phage prohead protease
MKAKLGEQRLIEFRAVDSQEGKMIIEGYAVVYEQPSTIECGGYKFTEVIKRGALDFTDMSDVPLRYNHNDTWCIMARTRNNSLQLIKDDKGLKITAELIDTQSNRDIYLSIQNGLIDKMSFSFDVEKGGDTWKYGENETMRTVESIRKLYDVSVVDTPFYDTTSIYARSKEILESNLKSLRLESLEFRKKKILLLHEI